jgi:hypothetical protein
MDYNFIQVRRRQKSSNELLQLKHYAQDRILSQML